MSSGKAERVAELIHDYGRMVFATAYRILGNLEDAEDAYQEVFLKVLDLWDSRLKHETINDWGAYLRVMASRNAVDILRRKRDWNLIATENPEDIATPHQQNPRNHAIQNQKAMLLRNALRLLPTREARIFALRYFEDLSYQQIAEHMRLSISLVGVIIHRARGRLRTLLKPLLSPEQQTVNEKGISEVLQKESRHV